MSELYKGIAGSPITQLVGDITDTQVSIAIADDTALPDAPNICTIGYGEHIETIRYGAKSNGVLQDVTRGIEGTPRAWASGTEVARFFTAHDHLAIIDGIAENADNHKTHEAESAKKHTGDIVDNQHGSYVKFDNGLLMCFALTSTIGLSAETTSTHIITLPAEFKDTSYTAVITAINVHGDVQYISAMLRSSDKTKNSITARIRNTYSSELEVSINLMAIGIYK